MTTKDASHHPIRKAPLFTPYVVVWTMFGTLSLGVLAVLGLAPEWLEDLRPAGISSSPQSNQGQRLSARIASDVTALKDSVSQIQLDLAKVKTEVATQGEQHNSVSAEVAALAAKVAAPPVVTAESAAPIALPVPALAAPAGIAANAPAQLSSDPTAATSAPAVSAEPPKAPARVPKVINADNAASGPALETGSVAGQHTTAQAKASTDAISFGPAVVKQAPKPVGVKISSGASVDSLRLSWSLLAEKHADALKTLEPRYRTAGDPQNPTYDLVAGPLKSKAEAARVCKSLAAQGVSCTVGAFSGDVL